MKQASLSALFLLFLTIAPTSSACFQSGLPETELSPKKAIVLGGSFLALGCGLYLLNEYSNTLMQENKNSQQIVTAAEASYERNKARYDSLIQSPEKLATHPSPNLLEKELAGISIPEIRDHEKKLQKLLRKEENQNIDQNIKNLLLSLICLRKTLAKEILANPLFKKCLQKERRFLAYLAKLPTL